MTAEERKAARQAAVRRYHRTPKGQAALKRAALKQREKGSPAQKKWQAKNRDYWRKQTYGLTTEQWLELSKNGCGICGTHADLCVDHDHQTGKIRGALCRVCNSAIGLLKDDASLVARALKWLGGVP
jgi:hypothetical protein